MKNNKEYVMSFDFIPTKMLIDNPIMKLLINGDGSNSSGAIDGFSLNVKKHIVVKFTYKSFESRQYIEFRNGGMSGIFENFQLEDGATATAYSPYHKNTYPIPQAILNLDGYGESGNFVDFVEKKYHKGDGIIDISDIIDNTFQEPIEVEAGGTLTFLNSNGDGYQLPIQNEEEYIVSLADIGGGGASE